MNDQLLITVTQHNAVTGVLSIRNYVRFAAQEDVATIYDKNSKLTLIVRRRRSW